MNKLSSFTVLFVVSLGLGACTSREGTHRPWSGGDSGQARAQGGGAPGFAEVSAVFAKNCAACHPSKQPSDWMNYDTAKAGASAIMRRVVVAKDMPQKGSAQEATMTTAERELVGAWVRAGAPKQATAASSSSTPSGENEVAAETHFGAIASCVGCHGEPPTGPSDPTIPVLAGQNTDYLVRRLTHFKQTDPWDQSSPMNKIAFGMTGADIVAAAEAYTAAPGLGRDTPVGEITRPQDFERGRAIAVENCVMCHQNVDQGYRTNDPLVPALVGQNEAYLRGQLYAFRTGARRNKEMYEYANALTPDDVEAVSYYFATITNAR